MAQWAEREVVSLGKCARFLVRTPTPQPLGAPLHVCMDGHMPGLNRHEGVLRAVKKLHLSTPSSSEVNSRPKNTPNVLGIGAVSGR